MTFDSFNVVFYTFAFLVPGFVCAWVYSMVFPERPREVQVTFLRFFSLSCINYAGWSWLIYLILNSAFFADHPICAALAWVTIIFVSPVLLAVLGAIAVQKGLVQCVLRKFQLKAMHPIPTAWDYIFGKLDGSHWIVVTLKDGTKIRGLFASGSFASSERGERDLYIEKVYTRPNSEGWQPVDRSAGMLIHADEIKHVEFVADDDKEKHDA